MNCEHDLMKQYPELETDSDSENFGKQWQNRRRRKTKCVSIWPTHFAKYCTLCCKHMTNHYTRVALCFHWPEDADVWSCLLARYCTLWTILHLYAALCSLSGLYFGLDAVLVLDQQRERGRSGLKLDAVLVLEQQRSGRRKPHPHCHHCIALSMPLPME